MKEWMTWNEFVSEVNAKLAELGKDGEIEIGFFDFTGRGETGDLGIRIQDKTGRLLVT